MTEPMSETDATVVVAVQSDQQPVDTSAALATSEIAAETAVSAVEASSAAVEVSTQAGEQAAVATDLAASAVESANSTRDALSDLREELNQRDARLLAALDERFGSRQTSDQPREVVVTHDNPAPSTNSGEGNNTGSSGGTGDGPSRPAYRHRFGSRRN